MKQTQIKKVKMSFDEFIELSERIGDSKTKCERWLDIDELEKLQNEDLMSKIEFVIWMCETAPEPETEEDKERKKKANDFMKNMLDLED